MRILIDNGDYELKNVGDIAMLQVAVNRIQNLFDSPDIYIFTSDPEKLGKYCPNTHPVTSEITNEGRYAWCAEWNVLGGLHKLVPAKFHWRIRRIEQWLRLRFPCFTKEWISFRLRHRSNSRQSLNAFFDLVNSSDIVVASGGGYITDAFDRHATVVLNTLGLAQSLDKPTYLYGQGLGPVKSPWLLYLCRNVLTRANLIALREGNAGPRLLESIGCDEQYCVTGDDAIELASSATPKSLGDALGINLRISTYSNFKSDFVSMVQDVIKAKQAQYGARLIPLPISCHDEDSDVKSISLLLKGLDDVDVQCPKTPESIIHQATQCRVVITGSYHAGLFSLSQGVSVIGLAGSQYYVDKFSGLADQFGTGCYVLEYNQERFAGELSDTIDRAWAEAESNREILIRRVAEQVELGYQAFSKMQTQPAAA
jgi:polysaccharide pyruvyl transferase WcaK-like protein